MRRRIKAKCFVILPFADEFIPLWEAIHDVASNEFDLLAIRSDIPQKHDDVTRNSFSHFHDSDLFIIDITGHDLSILFEFGYAAAQNKYIIPLTRGRVRELPSDLVDYSFIIYHPDYIDELKISLRSRLRLELTRIESERDKLQLEVKNKIAQKSFDVKCFGNRDYAGLDAQFSKAKNEIKILQTNMSTVVKNYVDSIQLALKANKDLGVNFLALDPESYFAAERANQLGKDVSEFRNDLRNALVKLHNTFKDNDNVEIRIYDDFPTQICYIIDGIIYNCVVSKYQPSRNNCVFMLSDSYPSLHTSFVLHFTSVWRDNKTTKKFIPLSRRSDPESL
jgi:hypothetical protein